MWKKIRPYYMAATEILFAVKIWAKGKLKKG